MKKLVILLTFLFLILSCKGKVGTTQNLTPLASFDLNDFTLYTFQLVGKEEKDSVPKFNNGLNKGQDYLVYDELYLLLENQGNTALYFTTFSHKYIFDGGVFNKSYSNRKILANQIDFLFIGTYDSKSIVFKNPKHHDVGEMKLNFRKLNDNILMEKVTNTYGKRRVRKDEPLVTLDSVFDVDIIFQKDERKFFFNTECNFYSLEEVAFNHKHVFFLLEENPYGIYKYYRRRVANSDYELFYHLKETNKWKR